jgi:M6 family metalloprotease-like protein
MRAALAAVALLAATDAGLCRGDEPAPLAEARRADLPPPDVDPFLGLVLGDSSASALVERIVPGSPAETAGVASGDVVTRFGDTPIASAAELTDAIAATRIGARIGLRLEHRGHARDVVATVAPRRRPDECFRGGRFVLAVVPIRFADDAAAPADPAALTRLLFAKTGRQGAGASVADYYRAQSRGRLDVTGAVTETVTLPKPRSAYASHPMGGSPGSAFVEAAALAEARDPAALRAADGIAFLYGGAPETRPSFALWPHRATVTVGGHRVPYYVHAVGDGAAIGVHCHEFGHLLGLPDAYGAGHVTGCGDFCLMAIGHRGGPSQGACSPFSLCAWCRMRLGWSEPVVLDPRVGQRIRLSPSDRSGEVAVVPLSPRTDEYLLLEVRARTGFDAELPDAGLLVWHVGGAATPGQGRYGAYADLVEAHGLDRVDASLVRTGEIAFPTSRARDLTPDTQPSVRTSAGDGLAVYLTDIAAAPGGCVDVTLGVTQRVHQAAPVPLAEPAADSDGVVVRVDPITGAEVRLYVEGAPVGPVPAPMPATGGEERR